MGWRRRKGLRGLVGSSTETKWEARGSDLSPFSKAEATECGWLSVGGVALSRDDGAANLGQGGAGHVARETQSRACRRPQTSPLCEVRSCCMPECQVLGDSGIVSTCSHDWETEDKGPGPAGATSRLNGSRSSWCGDTA